MGKWVVKSVKDMKLCDILDYRQHTEIEVEIQPSFFLKLFGSKSVTIKFVGYGVTWHKLPDMKPLSVKTNMWLYDVWNKRKVPPRVFTQSQIEGFKNNPFIDLSEFKNRLRGKH